MSDVYDVCSNYNPEICGGNCQGKDEPCFDDMFEIDEECLTEQYKEGKLYETK